MAETKPILINIFLRGAFDALNVVVPYADPDYARRRPGIAIASPGEDGGLGLPIPVPGLGGSGQEALDLDGFFGLHPSLPDLQQMFLQGELAPVVATGLPAPDRSHFSAQLRMEVAAAAGGSAPGGWLGRYLAATASSASPALRGISIGTALDQALSGSEQAAAIADNANYALQSRYAELWDAGLPQLHDPTVGGGFASVQHRVFAALELIAEADPAAIAPDPAAAYPNDDVGNRLRQVAQYIKAQAPVDVYSLNSGGWDHHVGENSALPPLLSGLNGALAALRTDLGEHWQRTVVVLMSEFGRTVNENASGGTDHGRGSAMLLLGGPVAGGQVQGIWPGLADDRLDSTGDLAVTIDYRQVLAQLLEQHMQLPAGHGAQIFPGLMSRADLRLLR